MPQRFCRIVKMLEDIEHQHEEIRLRGSESRVKPSDADPSAMRAEGVHDICIWLDSFYFAEFSEPAEEQAVSASHIEDAQSGIPRQMLAEDAKYSVFASPPPPMPRVEVAVKVAILWVHGDSSEKLRAANPRGRAAGKY